MYCRWQHGNPTVGGVILAVILLASKKMNILKRPAFSRGAGPMVQPHAATHLGSAPIKYAGVAPYAPPGPGAVINAPGPVNSMPYVGITPYVASPTIISPGSGLGNFRPLNRT